MVSQKIFPASDTSPDKTISEPAVSGTGKSVEHFISTISFSMASRSILMAGDFFYFVFERIAPSSDEYQGDVYVSNVEFINFV